MATAAAGCLLRPFPAEGFSSGVPPVYFPHYVDVAKQAGLLAKTVLVGHESKDFLLSTTGGGIALFDYDNDGWLDIFVVNGWGLKEFPKGEEAHKSPVPQQPQRNLYRCNREGRTGAARLGTGRVRRRLRQRR